MDWYDLCTIFLIEDRNKFLTNKSILTIFPSYLVHTRLVKLISFSFKDVCLYFIYNQLMQNISLVLVKTLKQ